MTTSYAFAPQLGSHTCFFLPVNLPGSSSFLPEETYLHRFYTARTYIEHYDKLLSAGNGNGNASSENGDDNASTSNVFHRKSLTSSKMASSDVDKLLDSLRIDADRRDTIVGDAFTRGLNPGEQRRLELGLQVLGAPDNVSFSLSLAHCNSFAFSMTPVSDTYIMICSIHRSFARIQWLDLTVKPHCM